ncbi:MAG: leucyl aminopeptidase [Acidobacteria bacterium]|nr:leucyl aminopeptidase [Acidobacteriota bacterium]
MKTGFVSSAPAALDAAALVILDAEGPASPLLPPAAAAWRAELHESKEFTGKLYDLAILHRPEGVAARRVVLAGTGPADKFTPAKLRNLVGAVVRKLKEKSVSSIALALDAGHDAGAAIEGAILGNFEPDRLKSKKEGLGSLESFTVCAPEDARAAFDRGVHIGHGQNFARDLVNEPGNLLTPTVLAARGQAMAAAAGLECEVLDRDRMRQLGMGSLLGVSQGSAEPPAFIIVRYRPAQAAPSNAHLALIGKGVTFDTGGISIKPAESMEKMKYDMAGGAAVLGAMQAIAALKPAIPVTAYVPTVENMPGSRAQRPGDIVTSLSGKTIEVLNTDAEGRLILNDAMTYARREGATHLVDAATLTGAIVIALGGVNAGLFANNDDLANRVLGAAAATGEKMWRMPMDDEYKDMLKTPFADLPNIGTRGAGSITAAKFLEAFAEETPWVHLDIAGTAWLDEAKPYLAKGPTGLPVRTFIQLAMGW